MDSVKWTPDWPEEPPAEIRYEAYSSVFSGFTPSLPNYNMSYTLKPISSRSSASIHRLPNITNDYKLIIDFDDNAEGGSKWYEVMVQITPPPPTLVILKSFTAASDLQGKEILLEWDTASEDKNLGFNIFRSENNFECGPYKKINKKRIASKGSSSEGASYKFKDNTVEPGKTYWYKLKDIDTDKVVSEHGPVEVKVPFPSVPRTYISFKLDGKPYTFTKNTGGRFISSKGYTELFASGKKKILITFEGESERNYPISVSYPDNRITILSKDTDKILYYTTYPRGEIKITHYGRVGAYIKGKFEGVLVSSENPNEQHTIEGSFKVKREND